MDIRHPGYYLQQELLHRGRTQKEFARLISKRASEVNELIKGKRNITVHRDILLSHLFQDPEKKRLLLQMEYDYVIGKKNIDLKKIQEIQIIEEQTASPAEEKEAVPEARDKSREHEIFNNF